MSDHDSHRRSHSFQKESSNHHHNENVQDEARSFRSKVSAIKMLARQQSSFDSFFQYLDDIGKSEYLVCFRDIEEIKKLEEDQMISRTYALVCRYKTLYEEFKIGLINGPSERGGKMKSSFPASGSKHLIWDCFGKLKSLDYTNVSGDVIHKHLLLAENDLISRLVIPFESYLTSSFYKKWQDEQLELEKQRNSRSKSTSINSSILSPRMSGTMTPSNVAVSITSRNGSLSLPLPENYSSAYADILIVDDSNITLKITGKTLEQDGHHVDKATNGQIALNLMKSRAYDVVLIDCNMPVMDGFEAVRLFREFEKTNSSPLYFPSDVSSISDSQEDPMERISKSIEKSKRKKSQIDSMNDVDVQDAANTETLEIPEKDIAAQPKFKAEGKLKRSLTAAHYHQLIIGMSTNIDEETKSKAIEAGMDFFLPKPFTLKKFIDTIKLSREQKEIATKIKQSDRTNATTVITGNP